MVKHVTTIRFDAIGTTWQIDCHDMPLGVTASSIKAMVTERITVFDKVYSRFRDDSLVAEMARKAGRYELPPDGKALFDLYERLYRLTGGKVTPLIGQVLADAGYDAKYSLVPKDQLSKTPRWEDILSYDGRTINLARPALLDVGAAGKGYLVDIVSKLLVEAGVTKHSLDAGGDILVRGLQDAPLRIGLEHPRDPSQAIGTIELGEGSICASASNRRVWGTYHHIMDPHSSRPVRSVIATWAVANSAMVADGLATALFFTEPGMMLQEFDFEYLLVRQDMSYESSPGLQAEMFIAEAS